MSITDKCGHHCAISNGYEGHCICKECHNDKAHKKEQPKPMAVKNDPPEWRALMGLNNGPS